ncbi:TPA: transposase family protein [Escherichia coli]|nr:transposase family protein [Escherichia coli]HBN0438022.1 transposase family protein [Escherichia coli]
MYGCVILLIHSAQGCQYTSHEWKSFLNSHDQESRMSRRNNCHDNAVAEGFFQLLKRARIKEKDLRNAERPREIFLITSK